MDTISMFSATEKSVRDAIDYLRKLGYSNGDQRLEPFRREVDSTIRKLESIIASPGGDLKNLQRLKETIENSIRNAEPKSRSPAKSSGSRTGDVQRTLRDKACVIGGASPGIEIVKRPPVAPPAVAIRPSRVEHALKPCPHCQQLVRADRLSTRHPKKCSGLKSRGGKKGRFGKMGGDAAGLALPSYYGDLSREDLQRLEEKSREYDLIVNPPRPGVKGSDNGKYISDPTPVGDDYGEESEA